jgi:CubicO group peptidase (beta-lactamase class C family)
VSDIEYIAILAGLLAILGARADAFTRPGPGADDPAASVRAYLDTLEQAGFSGAVLVELHGKVVISEGYGYSDALNRRKNSSRTVFDIGSITKQFAAAAILKLEME